MYDTCTCTSQKLFSGVDLTLSQTTNFRLFLTERVYRTTILDLIKDGGKFSERVENIVGKEKIARYQ